MLMLLPLPVFLPWPCILLYMLVNTQHQSHHFCYEADVYLYHIRTLLQIPPIYLFLVTFSYLPNNFSTLFYYIFSSIFEISYPLEYFLALLAYSSCTNHIPPNPVQMDQNLFLLFVNNNVLALSIFFVSFSQLALAFHQLILAHFFSSLEFSFFLLLGQL